jgi:hypothetical protein
MPEEALGVWAKAKQMVTSHEPCRICSGTRFQIATKREWWQGVWAQVLDVRYSWAVFDGRFKVLWILWRRSMQARDNVQGFKMKEALIAFRQRQHPKYWMAVLGTEADNFTRALVIVLPVAWFAES